MLLWAPVILLLHVGFASSMPSNFDGPENITVTFLNPTSVRVSWASLSNSPRKYEVMYKPTGARVVASINSSSDAITLVDLHPDTQYSLTVTAVWLNKKIKSRAIVFRTLEPPRTSPQQESGALSQFGPMNNPGVLPGNPVGGAARPASVGPSTLPETEKEFPPIRGVEVGIVILVLLVWVGAIALFFNRWGKIRMLLPYQPDYKQEQLKVPGTGVCSGGSVGGPCTGGGACTGQHVGPGPLTACVQHAHCCPELVDECPSGANRPRARVNSAIFISSEGPGFETIEFMRRHGSQSRLCRKARSADNIQTLLPTLSVSGPSPPEERPSTDKEDDPLVIKVDDQA